jgi:hypothetical protein
MSEKRWHRLFRACLACERTDAPYEARGLCHPCFTLHSRYRQLHRFPRLDEEGAGDRVGAARRAHRAAVWQRQRIIYWRPLATDQPHIQHAAPGGSPLPDTRLIR